MEAGSEEEVVIRVSKNAKVVTIHGASQFALPEDLKEFLVNFNNDELLQNPKNVLRSIIRMQAMITGGMGGLIEAIDQDQSVIMEFG